MTEKNEVRLNARVTEETKKRLKIFMAENNLNSYDDAFTFLMKSFELFKEEYDTVSDEESPTHILNTLLFNTREELSALKIEYDKLYHSEFIAMDVYNALKKDYDDLLESHQFLYKKVYGSSL